MVYNKYSGCDLCGGELKHYDTVKRIIRTGGGESKWIYIKRFKCNKCGAIHRDIPASLIPFVQYSKAIVISSLDGTIACNINCEDYPCDTTISRWRKKHKPYYEKKFIK